MECEPLKGTWDLPCLLLASQTSQVNRHLLVHCLTHRPQGNGAKWTWTKAMETVSQNYLLWKLLISRIWLSNRMLDSTHLKQMGPTQPLVTHLDSSVFLLSGQNGNCVTEIPWSNSILSSAMWNHSSLSVSLLRFPQWSDQSRSSGSKICTRKKICLFGKSWS